jgi:hypothetical protein
VSRFIVVLSFTTGYDLSVWERTILTLPKIPAFGMSGLYGFNGGIGPGHRHVGHWRDRHWRGIGGTGIGGTDGTTTTASRALERQTEQPPLRQGTIAFHVCSVDWSVCRSSSQNYPSPKLPRLDANFS